MNNSFLKSNLPTAAWALSAAAITLVILVWGQNVRWDLGHLTVYAWFPLFGLTAFTLMWGHYMIAATRQATGADAKKLWFYFRATSWVVLVALLLHPGLLIWRLWADGFGLPPQSYLANYVAPELGWVAGLGSLSLMAFLAFEFWRWFEKKPWWRIVSWASEFAMLAVFYHGLRLGGELQTEWFRFVWFLFGLSLVAAFAYLHAAIYKEASDPEPWRTRGAIVGVVVTVLGVWTLVSALLV